jgi:hypothetical protein
MRHTPRLRFWLDGSYDRDQVEDCEYHPHHRWHVARVIDMKPEHEDPDELMAICMGCFVPRCGYTTETNPCMLPRHHECLHLFADGTVEDATVWPGSDKPPPPDLPVLKSPDQKDKP